jgi:hypothetical protein
MDVSWWAKDVARLRKELTQAETMLKYEKKVRDIRAEHERVAAEREDWQWIPTDRAVLTADGTWAEK